MEQKLTFQFSPLWCLRKITNTDNARETPLQQVELVSPGLSPSLFHFLWVTSSSGGAYFSRLWQGEGARSSGSALCTYTAKGIGLVCFWPQPSTLLPWLSSSHLLGPLGSANPHSNTLPRPSPVHRHFSFFPYTTSRCEKLQNISWLEAFPSYAKESRSWLLCIRTPKAIWISIIASCGPLPARGVGLCVDGPEGPLSEKHH